MYLIERLPLTDAMFLAGSVTEPSASETEWASGGTYAVGTERTRTSKHRVYKCAVARSPSTVPPSTTPPEDDKAGWQEMRPTDRYVPFGPYVSASGKTIYRALALESTTADLTYRLLLRYCNAIALFGLRGAWVRVRVWSRLMPTANALTAPEFAGGLADAPVRAGLLTATTLQGYAGAIAFGHDGVTPSYAYKTATLVAGRNCWLSVIVEMTDGAAPAFASINDIYSPANSFVLVAESWALSPATYVKTQLADGRWLVSVPFVSTGTGGGNFGVVKYTTNSNRTFKVTLYRAGEDLLPNLEYDTTHVLKRPSSGYWDYAFGQKVTRDRLLIPDLPIFPGADVRIDIGGSGSQQRRVSQIEFGKLRYIPGTTFGGTEYGVARTLRARLYREQDDAGNEAVLLAGASQDLQATVVMEGDRENAVLPLLRSLVGKGVAVVPHLSPGYEQSLVFGAIDAAPVKRTHHNVSQIDISVRGLPVD